MPHKRDGFRYKKVVADLSVEFMYMWLFGGRGAKNVPFSNDRVAW